MRRRRGEASPEDLFVERLLGLQLTQEQIQRGKTFIAGAVDRLSGESAEASLTSMFALPDALPTPAELDAPGLWIARLSL